MKLSCFTITTSFLLLWYSLYVLNCGLIILFFFWIYINFYMRKFERKTYCKLKKANNSLSGSSLEQNINQTNKNPFFAIPFFRFIEQKNCIGKKHTYVYFTKIGICIYWKRFYLFLSLTFLQINKKKSVIRISWTHIYICYVNVLIMSSWFFVVWFGSYLTY